MSIRVATTDAEIAACSPVVRELRPHVEERDFVSRVRRQEQSGYRLAYLEEAARAGCGQMHLDSGVQRKDAHRFYEREGMTVTSLHFVRHLGASKPGGAGR